KVIPVRRSARTHQAPERLCLNVEVEEHSLGDLNEPANYKAIMLDSESNKSKRLFGLSQSAYKDKILKRYRMDNSKCGYFPIQETLDLNKTQGASTPGEVKRMQNVPYASVVGSIMYANPGEPHWTTVKTILKYLRNTKDMFLVYGGNPEAKLRVDCYCDAGFETDRDDTNLRQDWRAWAPYIHTSIDVSNGKCLCFYFCFVVEIPVSSTTIQWAMCIHHARTGCEALVKNDMPDKLQQRSVKCIFIGYPKETMGYYFYFPPENKIVVARYAEFFEKNLLSQEVSGRAGELEEIQDEDTSPSEITSEIPMEVEEVEEHSLGDLNEPANYKAAMLYQESNKWLDAMNAEMQSMKIIQFWRLMDNSKRGYIPMQERLDLNKTQGASTPGEVKLDCYCDAGFETDRDDTKSQTGYVFILNGGVVDWKSSKQSTTAMSATEAKYIPASEAAMEAIWIRKFISGLGIVPTINQSIRMFCDNSAAFHFANEPGVQKGARHHHRRYHYVREIIALGEIRFLKVHTNDNLADPFMKALSKGKLTQHFRSMGLRLASSFM
ncbi:hypothetical protein Tco_0961358, partial [Tanacetum coccineum]